MRFFCRPSACLELRPKRAAVKYASRAICGGGGAVAGRRKKKKVEEEGIGVGKRAPSSPGIGELRANSPAAASR